MDDLYDLAVFDFDGTLADTFGCIAASTDIALAQLGLPPADEQVLRSSVGLSLPTIFHRVTGGALPEPDIDRLVCAYRSVFDEIASSKVTLFDGVREEIETLHHAGVTLAVATSKSRRGVGRLLGVFEIADLFAVVVTDDMVDRKKPDPQMLHHVLGAVDVGADRAVMVGDAEFDLVMGRAGGMATCAVTWGNGRREQLEACDPTHIVDSPSELATTLAPTRVRRVAPGGRGSRL